MLPPGVAKARKRLLALPEAENTQKDRKDPQRNVFYTATYSYFVLVIAPYDPNKASVLPVQFL